MDNKHTEHINDDFLKGLVKFTDEDKPSVDFTQKIMAKIPRPVVEEQEEKFMLRPWQWVAIVASLIGVMYFIFAFDLTSLIRQATDVSGSEGINYLNILTSFVQLISQAFSGFQFTSITLMILISGLALYFGDKFLRKWSSARAVVA